MRRVAFHGARREVSFALEAKGRPRVVRTRLYARDRKPLLSRKVDEIG